DLSAQLDGLAKQREALADRLAAVSQQGSQVQAMLSIVLGAAGLLTLAQGFFAFFSAQNYIKQAEDAIKRANDSEASAKAAAERANNKMDALASEIRDKFPMFAEIESARSATFDEISRLTPALDRDYENLYAISDPFTRQRLLAIEGFSGIQFL